MFFHGSIHLSYPISNRTDTDPAANHSHPIDSAMIHPSDNPAVKNPFQAWLKNNLRELCCVRFGSGRSTDDWYSAIVAGESDLNVNSTFVQFAFIGMFLYIQILTFTIH